MDAVGDYAEELLPEVLDAITAKYVPAVCPEEATNTVSTDEICAAIRSARPDIKFRDSSIPPLLIERGFQLGIAEGSVSISIKWLLRERKSE